MIVAQGHQAVIEGVGFLVAVHQPVAPVGYVRNAIRIAAGEHTVLGGKRQRCSGHACNPAAVREQGRDRHGSDRGRHLVDGTAAADQARATSFIDPFSGLYVS